MSTDPDELLDRLREAGGEPPLPPLRIGTPGASARPGVAGRLVDRARLSILRLLAPSFGHLLSQLERDRHRQRTELERLRERVERLEADAGRGE